MKNLIHIKPFNCNFHIICSTNCRKYQIKLQNTLPRKSSLYIHTTRLYNPQWMLEMCPILVFSLLATCATFLLYVGENSSELSAVTAEVCLQIHLQLLYRPSACNIPYSQYDITETLSWNPYTPGTLCQLCFSTHPWLEICSNLMLQKI